MTDFFSSESESPEGLGADFVAETVAVRDAALLPTLSARLRARVVNAALQAYRRTRRLSQARQAASFLTTCLLASFVISPIAIINWPNANDLKVSAQQWPASLASVMRDADPIELPQSSIWRLRQPVGQSVDRHHPLPLRPSRPLKPAAEVEAVVVSRVKQFAMARLPEPTDDPLLARVRSSNEWVAVEAFQAIRVRNLQSLSRVVVTN